MSLLPRLRFGRARETEILETRVLSLQAALSQCALSRWALGELQTLCQPGSWPSSCWLRPSRLGTYREPIHQSIVGLSQAIGATSRPSASVHAAYQKGDYEAVLRLGHPLAAEGDARAQSILGLLHYRGRGVPQDTRRGGSGGFARLAIRGMLPPNSISASCIPKAAACRKDRRRSGEMVSASPPSATMLLAQYNLALSIALGVKLESARQCQRIFGSILRRHAFPEYRSRRSAAATNRDLMASKMTPDQLAAAQRWARDWKPKQ